MQHVPIPLAQSPASIPLTPWQCLLVQQVPSRPSYVWHTSFLKRTKPGQTEKVHLSMRVWCNLSLDKLWSQNVICKLLVIFSIPVPVYQYQYARYLHLGSRIETTTSLNSTSKIAALKIKTKRGPTRKFIFISGSFRT